MRYMLKKGIDMIKVDVTIMAVVIRTCILCCHVAIFLLQLMPTVLKPTDRGNKS